MDLCAKIAAVFSESDAVYLLVLGDFNCECKTSSRYYDIFMHFMSDNSLVCSDVICLDNAFTFCR